MKQGESEQVLGAELPAYLALDQLSKRTTHLDVGCDGIAREIRRALLQGRCESFHRGRGLKFHDRAGRGTSGSRSAAGRA